MMPLSERSLPHTDEAQSFFEKYQRALACIHRDVLGLDDVIEHIFIALLADGHVILEGEPGVGKTLVARTIARTIDTRCSYIQFTPETMPQDLFYCVRGLSEGKTLAEMTMDRGPLFSPIVIGDEINRAIPRIHGAILAPLEEKILSLEGVIHDLKPFYFWMATQNPVESAESTSLLPAALQERFILMVQVPYPQPELLRRIALHDTRPSDFEPVFTTGDFVSIRREIFQQYVLSHETSDPVIAYIQRLVKTIHDHPVVRWGPGIRAVQDLTRAAAAHAFLHGHAHLTFDSIKAMARATLRFKFQMDIRRGMRLDPPLTSNDDVINHVIETLPLVEEQHMPV